AKLPRAAGPRQPSEGGGGHPHAVVWLPCGVRRSCRARECEQHHDARPDWRLHCRSSWRSALQGRSSASAASHLPTIPGSWGPGGDTLNRVMPRSVRRAAEVLDLFSVERPYWGPSEVAGQLGIAKSSAHALLAELARAGLTERLPCG